MPSSAKMYMTRPSSTKALEATATPLSSADMRMRSESQDLTSLKTRKMRKVRSALMPPGPAPPGLSAVMTMSTIEMEMMTKSKQLKASAMNSAKPKASILMSASTQKQPTKMVFSRSRLRE